MNIFEEYSQIIDNLMKDAQLSREEVIKKLVEVMPDDEKEKFFVKSVDK